MRRFILFVLMVSIFFINGCGPSQNEYDALKNENASLKSEIKVIKKELEDLKFGPSRLLAQGKILFENKEYDSAINTLKILLDKHHGSNEASEANDIIKNASIELKKIKKSEAERIEREEKDKKKQLAEATKKMTKKYDELEKINWYSDASTHPFETSVHLYFGKKEHEPPWLRLKIRYHSDGWLFVNSYFVVADDKRFEKPIAKFERDHGSGSIWEWYDEGVSPSDIAMIKEIIKSKKATIRFIGNQHRKDHTISVQEKKALQNVIDAFVALGGHI